MVDWCMARIGEQGTRPGFSGFVVPLARFGAWRELVHGENLCIGAWRECVQALVDWCMARIGEQGGFALKVRIVMFEMSASYLNTPWLMVDACVARLGEQGIGLKVGHRGPYCDV
jgi:hypothetical protein